jgi:outer membrane protein assembly factor BamB
MNGAWGARKFCVLATVFVIAGLAGSASPSDWPMFRRDLVHSGWTSDEGAGEDDVAWSYSITPPDPDEPLIWSSPVVADSRVYFTGRDGYFYCLTLNHGVLVWRRPIGSGDPLTSTPAISNGKAYFLSGPTDRVLYCYDAETGYPLWSSEQLGGQWCCPQLPAPATWLESSPAVIDGDGVAFVGAGDGRAYRICTVAPHQGEVLWESDVLGDYITSSPAIADERVFIGATTRPEDTSGVYCLSEKTGDIIWQYEYPNGNAGGTMSSPTVVNGKVYIGANEDVPDDEEVSGGIVLCFDVNAFPVWPQQADPLWEQHIGCDVRGCPLVINGRVYVTTGQGLFAFDAETGDLIPGLGVPPSTGIEPGGVEEWYSSFAASDNSPETYLYVGDGGVTPGSGSIWCLDTELQEVWRYQTPDGSDCWASPAIADGRVLMCFRDTGRGRMMPPIHAVNGFGGEQEVRLDAMTGAGVRRASLVAMMAHPNPFAGDTRITYDVPGAGAALVLLSVYDASGRLVRTLIDRNQSPGRHCVDWDGATACGSGAEGGVYYSRLEIAGTRVAQPLLLIR